MGKQAPLVLAAVAAIIAGGCAVPGFGGSDGGPGEGGSSRPASARALGSCLEGAGATLRTDGSVPGKPRDQRDAFEPDRTTFRGTVYWRNGNAADVWAARDEDAAEAAESKLAGALSKFGKGTGSDLITRRGLSIYAVDDFAPPSRRERSKLERCL